MFLYHSMQWGEANATVGFNFGDRERSFTLSDRFTSSIDRIFIDFDASSNVGIPGAYIFQIDQDEIIQPQGIDMHLYCADIKTAPTLIIVID